MEKTGSMMKKLGNIKWCNIKALSQLLEQERAISMSVQNSSILASNAKRSYLGVQFKKNLSRPSAVLPNAFTIPLQVLLSFSLEYLWIHYKNPLEILLTIETPK